jgi:hypothetical protein
MTTVYSTETPVITTERYHFTYPTKRDAYVDCCYAVLNLNQVAKVAPDNYRHHLYRLKNKWIETLYRRGYCVQAYEDYNIWHFKFKVDGIVFGWHVPGKVVTWQVREERGPIWYEYIEGLPLRTRPLAEAIASLEWCLGECKSVAG